MMNHYRIITVFPLAILLFFCTGTARAQWNTNTSVNLLISGLGVADMQSVPTTDGKTWIAFYTLNAGNYDMRAQLIDADGNKLLGPDGVLVSNKTSGSATYVFNAAVDGSNNLIVSMQDQRTGTMQAVLYKISEAGTHLWSPDGVVLGNGLAPWSTALSTGEVAVAWIEGTTNTLNLQKVTTGGTLAWGTAIPITVGTSATTRGQIVANLNGKFTMVYQKNAGGISTNLYAQQFNNSGTALFAPLQLCNQTTAGYRYYSIAADADTTYFGYYSSVGFRFNSFLQRINPSGTIPWGINGQNFNTSVGTNDSYQTETRINIQPGSQYVWSVCTFCDPNQTIYGVYIQKFNKTSGARMFTDQGKVVYPISSSRDTQAGDLALVNDNPMFMSYDNNYKIYATRLDATGNFAWTGNRVELSSTTAGAGNPKGRYCFTPVGPNRCSGDWSENRGGGEMGYAQGVTVGGLIGIDVTTQGGVPSTITVGGGTLQMVATVFPATANQSVTWSIVPGTGFATISGTGLVTGASDGTVWAKAVSVQDITLKDSLLITLSNQVAVLPLVVTLPASNITFTTASINGTVNANNFSSTASFQWGLTNAYGNTVAATPAQITGNTSIAVSAALAGLTSGTTYHYRCVGNNAAGTANGQDLTFTTQCLLVGTISSITGSQSLCAGSTGNVYSVQPYPGATSYVWTIPTGATITAGNNTNSITVSFSPTAQSGNFTVYATNGTCLSLTSQPYAVTVIPLPVQSSPISGVQVVCEGDQGKQYSVDPIPGVTTYVWTIPTGAVIASGQNTNSITVNYTVGSISGNITVYGTNSCGAGAVSVPLPIDVLSLPGNAGAITGPSHICTEASNVQYAVAAIPNAYGYTWTVPTGANITAGANTNQITVHFATTAVSGNISVTGTNGNCIGQSSAITVTMDPVPATPTITKQGDTLISSSNTGNQWYHEGVIIPGATAKKYRAVYSGNYTVVVTLNSCSSAVSNSILVLPVGVNETPFSKELQVFPNPNNGQFTLRMETLHKTEYNIEVYNSLGIMVWSQLNVMIDGAVTIPVDLKNSPAGAYLVVLRSNDNSTYRKISIIK